MLNFAMFLANSNQQTLRTIRFDSYCLHKVFITFHRRFMLLSISNAFKKLNGRQQNLTHIVLKITIVFRSALHFPMFETNFDERRIRSDTCYVLQVLSKKIFLFVSNIYKIGIKNKTD